MMMIFQVSNVLISIQLLLILLVIWYLLLIVNLKLHVMSGKTNILIVVLTFWLDVWMTTAVNQHYTMWNKCLTTLSTSYSYSQSLVSSIIWCLLLFWLTSRRCQPIDLSMVYKNKPLEHSPYFSFVWPWFTISYGSPTVRHSCQTWH